MVNFQDKFSEELKNTGFKMPELVQKNKAIAFVLCLLLGVFGVHRFYLGKFITGTLQLIFGLIFIWGGLAWICFVFAIIDIIRIAFDPRFTRVLKLNLNVNFTNFSGTQGDFQSNSPFSNMHNRDENDITIRELSDDEVIVTDSHQPKIIHGEDKR